MSNDENYHVIFDTSTLISAAILPSSIPGLALELAFGICTLYVSKETLLELENVLARPYIRRYRAPELIAKFFDFYLKSVEVIPVVKHVSDCRDKKDNKFLSLALAAQAQFIISSDDDLLALNPYRGISVIKPKAFIELIEKPKSTVQ
jgi:putative PIN family toxin of toxin-antitoxin system